MNQDEKNALNREIGDLLGWRFTESDCTWHTPECRCQSAAPGDNCTCLDGCYDYDDSDGVPFTDDWRAAMMLYEMMPMPQIRTYEAGEDKRRTIFWPDVQARYHENHPDPRIAICLAFKSWYPTRSK